MFQSIDAGEIKCGFGIRKDYEGQKDFDQAYKDIVIKKRVKKIGDGEEDFIIEEFEEVTETPIVEVLAASLNDAGIEAFLKPYELAGCNPPDVSVSDKVQDFTLFPEDPADAIKIGDQMVKAFASLDPALRGDAKTPEEFLSCLTQDKIDAYIASKLNIVKKEEVKE